MFRYRLRTLLMVLALGPMVIWAGWIALAPTPEPAFYEFTEGLVYPPTPPAGHHWEPRPRERRYVAVPNEP